MAPSFGLCLDERWAPPWPHVHVEWPDFGVPADLDSFRVALADALERRRRGEIVELGCLAGHGRTGTARASLAILTGTPTERCSGAQNARRQGANNVGFDPESRTRTGYL
jgi:protein-tyrosine phosphatase